MHSLHAVAVYRSKNRPNSLASYSVPIVNNQAIQKLQLVGFVNGLVKVRGIWKRSSKRIDTKDLKRNASALVKP